MAYTILVYKIHKTTHSLYGLNLTNVIIKSYSCFDIFMCQAYKIYFNIRK